MKYLTAEKVVVFAYALMMVVAAFIMVIGAIRGDRDTIGAGGYAAVASSVIFMFFLPFILD